MELVMAWHIMRRRRILTTLGVIVSALVFLAGVGGKLPGFSPLQTAGSARARVLVDTPYSLIADLRARADITGPQASLLSDLLAEPEQVAAIEREAGIPEGGLVVLRPTLTLPVAPSNLDQDAASVAAAPGVWTLSATTSTQLPIVTLNAVAPDKAAAFRLATAATTTLTQLADARAPFVPIPNSPKGFTIRQLGTPRSIAISEGGGSHVTTSLIAAIMMFLFWCGGVLVVIGLLRALRTPPRATTPQRTA
jgi:hypothetical protein